MSATTQTTQPSLADIVREVTGDGRLIAEFYLDVASGKLDGFRDHHRMTAARRLDKIAPGLVEEFLVKYYNPSIMRDPYRGEQAVATIAALNIKEKPEPARRGPNPFQRRLQKLVRKDTGDGRSIVDFLICVMEGYLTAFKPHHRLEAAAQLSTHLAPVVPSPEGPSSAPSPSTEETRSEGDSPADPIVFPAEAGTQGSGGVPSSPAPSPSTSAPSPSTGETRSEGDSQTTQAVIPSPEGSSPAIPTEPGTQELADEGRTPSPS